MASKMGRPVSNKHKVPQVTWRRWSNEARRIFNYVMHAMRPSCQWIFMHPKAALLAKAEWQTVRWNAAWMAAEGVDRRPHTTEIRTVVRG